MTQAALLAQEHRSQGRRGRARYLALFVPLFAVAELVAHFYFARRAPTTEEWKEVRPLVQSWYKAGTAVVIAPYWAEPVARLAFGDELMPLRDVARPDVTRYAETLEVSIMGSRAPELEGWKTSREQRKGKFTIRSMSNPAPAAVTFDFTDHVEPAAAAVRVEKKVGPVECGFNASAAMEGGGLGGPPLYPSARFVCPGEPVHVFVGVTIIDDEKSHPRRCIWSHPPGNDEAVVTRFHDVPLGTKIRGHAGAGWLIERDLAVPPFTIEVRVGGEEVGRVVHRPGDFWKPFEIPLGAGAGRTAEVQFRVSAPGGGTHVCFEADSR